jgi:hypothetical protein
MSVIGLEINNWLVTRTVTAAITSQITICTSAGLYFRIWHQLHLLIATWKHLSFKPFCDATEAALSEKVCEDVYETCEQIGSFYHLRMFLKCRNHLKFFLKCRNLLKIFLKCKNHLQIFLKCRNHLKIFLKCRNHHNIFLKCRNHLKIFLKCRNHLKIFLKCRSHIKIFLKCRNHLKIFP